ncbi:X-Pro dipeptidyl-peptidase protein [Filobasidium floriforme]|uniref:X-Pro dipeptidyl-peptidase protein n=1 Tax=Filobasidium floriforme TaxID=5210 RepID=UPI001E8CC3DA|nr:X-Pro dipeptidyl-peptidase protein [Filobasidium floriforme]KAH8083130.1 X-Pro dipeptidyl-peptidase protein [Filobasidium floriforme]
MTSPQQPPPPPPLLPLPRPNALREVIDLANMTFEKNVDIPLKDGQGLCRGNVYRPKGDGKWPVLLTYGPYGKDVPYASFHGASFSEIPDEQKSSLSAWETPHPDYWVAQGYVVVRVDERGIGSSVGFLDTMSDQTSSDFAEVIEWAADQSWSSGKVGLLGISYYGGSQWRVAARKPRGLACIIPWEGMTDYYRDRVRHGGILANNFVKFWWENQVGPMQYGTEEKRPRRFGPGVMGPPVGPECLEGSVPLSTRLALRRDQTIDNKENRYLDDPYHASRVYDLGAIEVPLLSVANLGGILLHLRGNVVGYMEAGTKNKWLYFISGRHDLPFYLPHFVKLQKSFLDAWLKGEDDAGWLKGPNVDVPAVSVLVRKGNPGFNTTEAEATFKFRSEKEWPIARTRYVKHYLQGDKKMKTSAPTEGGKDFELQALGKGAPVNFEVKFEEETEINGHPTANLVYSVPKRADGSAPKDIDVFLTLRHLDTNGREIYYTGTAGDPVPLCKGWLRASMRKIDESSPRHKHYLPHRNYESKDVLPVEPDTKYDLLVELWPTQVVVEKGSKIVLEVNTGDSQGCGIFLHNEPTDRSETDFDGTNILHVGPGHDSWLCLPIV